MVPSESAPQELSNEWSCQYVSKISNFCVLPLVTEVIIISPYGVKPFDSIVIMSSYLKKYENHK
jgi:hypothetical protein